MFYKVLDVKNLVNTSDAEFDKEILLENNKSSLNVISLKKDSCIDTHISEVNACVYVIEGKIEIHFENEKFTLDEKNMLMFEKNQKHKVIALKDSLFFVIKI